VTTTKKEIAVTKRVALKVLSQFRYLTTATYHHFYYFDAYTTYCFTDDDDDEGEEDKPAAFKVF